MYKKIKQMVKNQKGLTLVELLAVIVILGIIAAIAIPAIGNIIEKSKKDAHIANAQQLIAATRLAVASNDLDTVNDSTVPVYEKTQNDVIVSVKKLVDEGYLESEILDPEKKAPYALAYVKVTKGSNGIEYRVTLSGVSTAFDGESSYIYETKPEELNKGEGEGTAF